MCEGAFQMMKVGLIDSPYNYLEIGVFNGDSITALATLHPNKMFYGIDPFIEDGHTVNATGKKCGELMDQQRETANKNFNSVTNAFLYEVTSKQFADWLYDKALNWMNIGWVLVDGSHHYEDVKNDLALAVRLIGPRYGAIIVDDMNIAGVKQAYEEFTGTPYTSGDYIAVHWMNIP